MLKSNIIDYWWLGVKYFMLGLLILLVCFSNDLEVCSIVNILDFILVIFCVEFC